jgi:hypothetical protein
MTGVEGLRTQGVLLAIAGSLPPVVRLWLAIAMVPVVLVALLFAAFGAVALAFSWKLTSERAFLLRSGARVQGTVVRIEIVDSDPGDSSAAIPTRAPVVRFGPPGQDPLEFRSQGIGQFIRYTPGDAVTVLYDPSNPALAEIDSVVALSTPVLGSMVVAGAMLGVGLLFAAAVLLAAGLLWKAHARERRLRLAGIGTTGPPPIRP